MSQPRNRIIKLGIACLVILTSAHAYEKYASDPLRHVQYMGLNHDNSGVYYMVARLPGEQYIQPYLLDLRNDAGASYDTEALEDLLAGRRTDLHHLRLPRVYTRISKSSDSQTWQLVPADQLPDIFKRFVAYMDYWGKHQNYDHVPMHVLHMSFPRADGTIRTWGWDVGASYDDPQLAHERLRKELVLAGQIAHAQGQKTAAFITFYPDLVR